MSVVQLLNQFGAGKAVPGSGSAAVLQGLLAAKLLRTVIKLTKRKSEYYEVVDDIKQIEREIIRDVIAPLSEIFQRDSDEFETVVETRKIRDRTVDQGTRWQLASRAREELKLPTDLPIQVAGICLKLGSLASHVFDKGFKSASGDTLVAMGLSLQASYSSIGIAYLNLSQFTGEPWASERLAEARELQTRIEALQADVKRRLESLRDKAENANSRVRLRLSDLRDPKLVGQRIDRTVIEKVVKNIQNDLWKKRYLIWPGRRFENHVDVLQPDVVFDLLGYQFSSDEPLDHLSLDYSPHKVAGYIDEAQRFAAVSSDFPREVQTFTAAHELGHAVLHEAFGLHRDRSLDGSPLSGPRPPIEKEADIFAAAFLMPQNLVIREFTSRFGGPPFTLNDDSAFGLGLRIGDIATAPDPVRSLSRALASAESYHGQPFDSLATQFRVSQEAIAIRLEELNLVDRR